MNTVFVKLLNSDAILPTKANQSDAGWDLYSTEEIMIRSNNRCTIHTGISIQIPEEYVGLIWPRSGLSVKKGIDVLAGVVDSGYRGEIMVCLYNTSNDNLFINKGDRIAQILFQQVPYFNMVTVDELSDTDRGLGGFGSSGQ